MKGQESCNAWVTHPCMHIHTQNKLYAATTRITFYLYVSELLLLNRQRKSGSTHSRSFSTNGYPCQDTHIPWSPRPNLTKISHTHPSFFSPPLSKLVLPRARERETIIARGWPCHHGSMHYSQRRKKAPPFFLIFPPRFLSDCIDLYVFILLFFFRYPIKYI